MEQLKGESSDEVVQHGIEALRLLEQTPNPDADLLMDVRKRLSDCEMKRGNTAKGVAHAKEAVSIAQSVDDKVSLGWAHYQVGVAFFYAGKPSEGIVAAEQACQIFEHSDDKKGLAKSLTLCGAIQRSKSCLLESLVSHRKSLEISLAIADANGVAKSKNNIGLVYWQLDQAQPSHQVFGARFESLSRTRPRKEPHRGAQQCWLDS